MPEITWVYLDRSLHADRPWQAIAERLVEWAERQRRSLRDCIMLVPFAQLLAPARTAIAERGGWMPRVETTRTLAATLGPAPVCGFGEPTFDLAIDSMSVRQLLDRQGWVRAWQERDPTGFEATVYHIARTGHELARAAFGLQPDARPAYWAGVRQRLAPIDGPGAHDRRLVRLAAEWAALAPPPLTDLLFALRPAGWIVVCAGGQDALTMSLLRAAQSATPCLAIDTDGPASRPADRRGETDPPLPHAVSHFVCADFEEESQTTAALVIRHLQGAQQPVALIAQDRVLIRRVRALLDRANVSIVDETGWKLSTTRAAATVMSLLRAAQPGALIDHLLAWLKTGVHWPEVDGVDAAIRSLEAACRRHRIARISGLAGASLDARTQRLLACVSTTLGPLRVLPSSPPRVWANALNGALRHCGAMDTLSLDDAGCQVLDALRLGVDQDDWSTEPTLAGDESVSLSEFIRWTDASLELKTFLPRHDAPDRAQVVITPLVQAMLRPFAAVVFPGADDSRLGASTAPRPLLGDAEAVMLGLDGADDARTAEALAFAQLLQIAPTSFLRRRQEAGRPLGTSPLVEQLAIRLRREGRAFASPVDPRSELTVLAAPIERSAPRAPALLPTHLSASAYEALRECPYRFFARAVLRLREPDELDRDLEKRDYGTWLHEVLYRFHAGRTAPAPAPVEVSSLLALARACQEEFALSDVDFLPFEASFRALVPRYVEWLHGRDRQGLRWRYGEYTVALSLPAIPDITLEGQIDRIDELEHAGSGAIELIDYKTGNADALRLRVKQPLEDTQLAFYVALLGPAFASLRAGYLSLDSTKGVELIEHKGVARSAQVLLAELGSELGRLRSGASMPALGEGEICDRCEMRGLCRRDHWATGARESS